ncbi:MAG: hypothetical protein G3M70_16970 [Candidatus Nitronauta litoralis]|uniref:ABC-2 type transport system permease protein n=1 Tax=Candidatus Nitronauta litoralis TaxID=2705533 RepID=A0A7T0BYW4_9BACT|nr:MAG: hypothetical protein G3M70_16970 [Candidatus Nitronauta litoralis]
MSQGTVPDLAKLRWKFLKNNFKNPSSAKKNRWMMLGGLVALFIWGDYLFFLKIIRYLDTLPLNVGVELIVQLINVIFLTLFMMVLFSSIIASLSIFYVSSDLEFLHSLPVKTESVVQVRFLQTVWNASWMMWVFAIPIFVAYGRHFEADGGFYVYLILSFIPFVFIPSFLGVLGIMVLMRYFPTEKANQILSFLGLFFLVALVMFLRFLSPEKFFGKEVSDSMITGFVNSLSVPEYPFLPSSWMTHGLTSWVAGDIDISVTRLGFLIGGTLFGALVFWLVSRKIYAPGWRLYQEVKNAPQSKNRADGRFAWLEWVPVSQQMRALLKKDMLLFVRDPSQWSQMFILAALVVVYIFNIINLPLEHLVLKNVVSVLNIGLVGFVLSAIISRFGFSATSVEGIRMWSIYTAPVKMRNFLVAKFWMVFPPLLMLGELLVIVSNYILEADFYVMQVGVISVFLITLALVGMGVGMGAMYPMFRYENVSEISSGTGGILFMISSLAFTALYLMLIAWPMHVHVKAKFTLQFIGGNEIPVIYGLLVFISLVTAIEPMRRGIKNLKQMDL